MSDIIKRLRARDAMIVGHHERKLGKKLDRPFTLEGMAADEIERLTAALVEIRDHWANEYDHPRKNKEMYRGPYGIGITDGHRACATIARAALAPEEKK